MYVAVFGQGLGTLVKILYYLPRGELADQGANARVHFIDEIPRISALFLSLSATLNNFQLRINFRWIRAEGFHNKILMNNSFTWSSYKFHPVCS